MKKWILLFVLIAALAVTSKWESGTPTGPEREELDISPVRPTVGKATLVPGRVVELQMKNGKIEFVLFEKDCPLTTKRISDLVAAKAYDGVKFPRVEGWIVQTDNAKSNVPNMNVEVLDRLKNVVGAVGMARKVKYDTNVSSFYFLKRPAHHLDREYTVFGQVIRGMDVVNKIKIGDVIQSAKVRSLTPEDKLLLKKALSSAK
ncbi:MAG: peptidylprolyl isomerase [Armatimonadetes bacterium]|nr:peptidylprolyl isomerase [Armatimonadota bacterium]